uniref:TLDc domain-containing protein n=1 Tax=Schistosoma curassoni TaxID=6186 RepID=A0A183K4F5_9TREM
NKWTIQHTTDSILDDFNKDAGELQQIRLDGGGSLGFLSEYSSDIVFIGDDNDNTVDGNVLDNDDDEEEEEEEEHSNE